jgi:hypothetical protein
MDKLAFFVEGRTEFLFIQKLLEEVAGSQAVHVEPYQFSGPRSKVPTHVLRIVPPSDRKKLVLVCDCGNDDNVKVRMAAQYDHLGRAGYGSIVCVRDVFPKTHADIPQLLIDLALRVKTQPIAVKWILQVLEIEAWFLAEHKHFANIDTAITVAAISAKLGFDPSSDDMQLRSHPAEDLNNCYQIGGRTYVKGDPTTTNALDYEHLYCDIQQRYPPLGDLCSIIDEFLEPPIAIPATASPP